MSQSKITIELTPKQYNLIQKELVKIGRGDLIEILENNKDEEYKPPPPKKKIKEFYEYYSGTDDEDTYTVDDVEVDEDGFWSLKE